MKILKIEINDPKIRRSPKQPYCIGQITVGKFSERFNMYLTTWQKENYKAQWKEGLQRIKTNEKSCLIADLTVIDNVINMEIYYLYKVDGKLLVHNQMYRPQIFKDLQKEPLPFDPFASGEDRYKNIPPIEYIDEDGNKLQLWEADLDGIIIEN